MLNYRRLLMPIIFLVCGMLTSCNQGSSRIQIIKSTLIDQKGDLNTYQPIIYFDNNDQLQASYLTYDAVKATLAQACSPIELTKDPHYSTSRNKTVGFETLWFKILLVNPMVFSVVCEPAGLDPSQAPPRLIVGVDPTGKISWKTLLNQWVVGASKDGIVLLFSPLGSEFGELSVISPQTGEILSPVRPQMRSGIIATYDAAHRLIYIVTRSADRYPPDHTSRLVAIHADTGMLDLLDVLPGKNFSATMGMTTSKKYLVIVTQGEKEALLVYDLQHHLWVGEKPFDEGEDIASRDVLLTFGKDNDVGVLVYKHKGAFVSGYRVVHFRIKDAND